MFPEKLNDFRVFANENPDLQGVSDIQLPNLKSLTETINGAGMLGEYESPNFGHFESMKLVLNWRIITAELLEFLKPDGIKVDCRMANQSMDNNRKYQFRPNRVLVQGTVISNDLGKVAKGSPYEGSTEIEVHYIKLEEDGKVLLEYDRHNYIYKVDGVDYGGKIKQALGY